MADRQTFTEADEKEREKQRADEHEKKETLVVGGEVVPTSNTDTTPSQNSELYTRTDHTCHLIKVFELILPTVRFSIQYCSYCDLSL